MDEETKEQLLHSVARVCVEHGFDCAAFVALLNAEYQLGIGSPEQALTSHLARFLFASLKWACPGPTPDMERRRHEAERAWACWGVLNAQRIRANRRRPAA